MGRKLIELTGKKFGRLTVIKRVEKNNSVVVWNCRCTCGNTKEVRAGNLKSGGVKSCGCLLKDIHKSESFSKSNSKHGLYNHPLYHTWSAMVYRCYNAKSPDYKNYGGRGIGVCDEWIDSPKKYIEDIEKNIGRKPTLQHTLDRIDNNGNYEITNLRWATKSEQSVNQRKKINQLKEKYIFKKRGLYIVSITRNKINMLSNGQKNINDAIKLRDFYLELFEENPEKWEDLCNNKKYKNIEILKESL